MISTLIGAAALIVFGVISGYVTHKIYTNTVR